MTGLQRIARRAILARLKAAADAALVPAARLYPQTVPAVPTWPFARLGPPQTLPRDGTCYRGADIAIPIDAFAKDRMSGAQRVETAEDYAGRIGAWIEGALHLKGETVMVDAAPVRLRYQLTDIRLFPDGGEAGAFHYSAQINVRAVAE